MKRNLSSCLVAACVLACLGSVASVASAAIVTQPGGLNPGEQYRLVFVTSQETYGRYYKRGTTDLTGGPIDIAGYNTFATGVAESVTELSDLGTTWKAVVSTEQPPPGGGTLFSAKANTGTDPNVETGVAIYNLAGELVASNNADLWDGSISNAIDVDELGNGPVDQSTNSSGQYLVWTGTGADGTGNGDTSLVAPSGGYIRYGHADLTDDHWIARVGDRSGWNANNETNSAMPIYVMSGVLTAEIPEPRRPLIKLK